MKKEEKTEHTRERIIRAAIQEFGTRGYAGMTLNALCNTYGISKGLLYHNFDGKDSLYLCCMEKCFQDVTSYLMQKETEIRGDLKRYMALRFQYFAANPLYARIFFEAVLQPPSELRKEIRKMKSGLEQVNCRIYDKAISGIKLREGITKSDAMEYYGLMQEMFNGYFSSPAYAGKELSSVITEHEEKLMKLLDFMIYGIAERGDEK